MMPAHIRNAIYQRNSDESLQIKDSFVSDSVLQGEEAEVEGDWTSPEVEATSPEVEAQEAPADGTSDGDLPDRFEVETEQLSFSKAKNMKVADLRVLAIALDLPEDEAESKKHAELLDYLIGVGVVRPKSS
jgi:hypothetical protein